MSQEIKAAPPAATEVSGFCPLHPRNNAIGRCRKCQQAFCDVCENRWQKEPICMACLAKVLESDEPTPGELETQKREGNIALALAILGWIMFLGSVWMFFSICGGGGGKSEAYVNVVLFLASFLPTLMSAGQAIATLRSRGLAQTQAAWALVLSALQIGVTLSIIALNIVHN